MNDETRAFPLGAVLTVVQDKLLCPIDEVGAMLNWLCDDSGGYNPPCPNCGLCLDCCQHSGWGCHDDSGDDDDGWKDDEWDDERETGAAVATHPDRDGGSTDAFQAVQEARRTLTAHFGTPL